LAGFALGIYPQISQIHADSFWWMNGNLRKSQDCGWLKKGIGENLRNLRIKPTP